MTALLTFTGFRAGQLCTLRLTDLHDGRLHLDDRTILLTAPMRHRLAAWPGDRSRRWPNSTNPPLSIHYRTATHPPPVDAHWLHLKLGSSVRAIREDRILDQAHVGAGGLGRRCALLGRGGNAASRSTATLDHQSLIEERPPPV